MKITIIGTGYVGLVTGACFAEMGNDVWCVDVDADKIDALKKGIIPIYEPGLDKVVQTNYKQKYLYFTSEIEEALRQTEICFIAVGTPMQNDGSADLQFVLEAARQIGKNMTHHMYVVNKSTVPVGTADTVRRVILNELALRNSELTFDVISNPEFLKEGSAIDDCMKPDRIVVGTDNDDVLAVMEEIYKPYVMDSDNILFMDVKSAEMTKYAANAMLATKISFINEIGNICERVGADINQVRRGIGSDKRIGYKFIYPGCGYGGSCFPKDVEALIHTSQKHKYNPILLQAVANVNTAQKHILATKIQKIFGTDLSDRTFAVWGLSFKPNTDDMRESPAITIINDLVKMGAHIQAYDPKAMLEAQNVYLPNNASIGYVESKYEAIKGADALILITEWKEFRSPDFQEIKKLLKHAMIFDGRNQYNEQQMKKYGIQYYPIGVDTENQGLMNGAKL